MVQYTHKIRGLLHRLHSARILVHPVIWICLVWKFHSHHSHTRKLPNICALVHVFVRVCRRVYRHHLIANVNSWTDKDICAMWCVWMCMRERCHIACSVFYSRMCQLIYYIFGHRTLTIITQTQKQKPWNSRWIMKNFTALRHSNYASHWI